MKSNQYTIAKLKEEVSAMQLSELADFFSGETRSGALKVRQAREKLIALELKAIEKYSQMLEYEHRYNDKVVCGIDEVGRGPLAGPVIACAVILNDGHQFIGLNDSKQLSKQKRTLMYDALTQSVTYAIGEASVEEIDALNIYEATKLAMHRAIQQLPVQPEVLLIDAMKLDTGLIEESIIKGDTKSISIAAASVIAKVYRDQLMEEIHNDFPFYDFKHNAGYGTKKHIEGLKQYGITNHHRKSFEPIKSMLKTEGNAKTITKQS
ncbi:ribonuclease HII [Macrococcus armenti]|uniref:ribonuclease HII n=1 Tax=Macrococcus armenti TaxID=2875764 RepID=UPI001CCD23EF|nr:ribonuclease HII [Macrococcus armenti]UBH09542.1 ribonuclease HII [Macrococcus armenti]UBH11818.1 ribonuclease HII [Macrococcus armenti]UBH23266.1 ribonuclease HII [Macrococcus armenti]